MDNLMNPMTRRKAAMALAAIGSEVLYAQEPKDAQPRDAPLQDPLPDQCLLYLVRAPHDAESLVVLLDGRKVATLPESTFTVMVVDPGRRLLQAVGARGIGPGLQLTAAAGERRFFYLSGVTGRPFGNGPLAFWALGVAGDQLLNQPRVAADSRTWKECSEQEARDLMAIARLVLPD